MRFRFEQQASDEPDESDKSDKSEATQVEQSSSGVAGAQPDTDTMKGKYENTNPLEKLHAGEPYFFLRAQDMHAPYAVRQYAEAVGVLDPKGKAECLAFADRMEKWQNENADKVKLPD